jgi:hypothetical protein
MNRPLQKGTRVSHAQSSAKTPSLRTGFFASLRGGGSGAPSLRLLAPVALAIAALLALASSALAARGHEFTGTIGTPCTAEPCGPGELKEPSGLAVNEASGASTQSISSASGRPHSSHPEALRSTFRVRGCSVVDKGNDRVQVFSSRGALA